MYQLRIELQDIKPTIWRSLRVAASVTLPKVHRIFQIVMGWTDTHLHEFEIGGVRYGIPDRDFPDESLASERRHTLGDVLTPSISRFLYRYDFGDGWEHDVSVEAIGAGTELPLLCLAGANACPPEDVGGPHGYAEFLKAIGNPRHPEHKNYFGWCGGAFDPSGFDLQSVNRQLRRFRV